MEAPVPPGVFMVHTMVLLVALAGVTVPFRVRVPTVPLVGTPVISLTATKAALRVMLKSLV
jgi:hypothetical protein